MIHDPADRISLQPHARRVRIYWGDGLVADADHGVTLLEKGYPDRQYLPPGALLNGTLRLSETQTHCPFKGNATYYDYVLDDQVKRDAVWCYETPYTAMAEIAGYLVFDPQHFDQVID